MDISQYGEDPDSAYGTEVYVPLKVFKCIDGIIFITEEATPHHWHLLLQITDSKTTGDIMRTKRAVRCAILPYETAFLIQNKAILTPMMRYEYTYVRSEYPTAVLISTVEGE